MTDIPPARIAEGPESRLTRLCETMIAALAADSEFRAGTDRAIVLLNDGHDGGDVMAGYHDDGEALADLLVHVQAIFEAHGTPVAFMKQAGLN